MIRIAIVEDEDHFAEQLRNYLSDYEKQHGSLFDIVRFRDGDEIVENYSGDYQIILMDIQMQFMDGMTAAETIRKLDSEVVIIFITNMENYAIRGYQVDALDYVLKPIEYPAFSVKLDRALARVKNRRSHTVTLRIPEGHLKIDIEQILYVESEGHNLRYKCKNGEYLTRQRISDAEEELLKYGFFRINKGCLVNLSHVKGDRDGGCLIGDEVIQIARARRNDYFAAMAEHIASF
ncbi:MAG: response regulator transcription factor [Lachnospiraceae bacterium]|nr:response regulator transcription factor [Lachnospiraceae bacterium]